MDFVSITNEKGRGIKMGLRTNIENQTLTKNGDLYLLRLVGTIIKENEESSFFYTLSLNEDGEEVEKKIDLRNPSKSEVEGWEKSTVITEIIHLAKESIKALKVLPAISKDDFMCVEENCKNYGHGSYNYACMMKNSTGPVFSIVLSKTNKPYFFTEIKGKDQTFFRMDDFLTEEMKELLIGNMKKYSKQRVRLLANGFYLHEK